MVFWRCPGHCSLRTSESFPYTIKMPREWQECQSCHRTSEFWPFLVHTAFPGVVSGDAARERGSERAGDKGGGPIPRKKPQDEAVHHGSNQPFLITPEITGPETVIIIMSRSRSEQEGCEPLTPTLVLEVLQGTLKGRRASHLS